VKYEMERHDTSRLDNRAKATMAAPKRTQVPRFKVGDRVHPLATLHSGLANKQAVVLSVRESRYAHTLDKYRVRLIDDDSEIQVWDIEIAMSDE